MKQSRRSFLRSAIAGSAGVFFVAAVPVKAELREESTNKERLLEIIKEMEEEVAAWRLLYSRWADCRLKHVPEYVYDDDSGFYHISKETWVVEFSPEYFDDWNDTLPETPYDPLREEIGAIRKQLAEKDSRIAELEERLLEPVIFDTEENVAMRELLDLELSEDA